MTIVGTPITGSTDSYCTVLELRTSLGIGDAVDDTELATEILAASREIDGAAGRHFYRSVAGTVRYYTATRHRELWELDDCVALTGVETDDDCDGVYEYTWLATDYHLLPENAAADGGPYTILEAAPLGSYRFPVGVAKGVKLTGTWGWPAVPDKIRRACILRAAWLFKRRDTPLGLSGSADLGLVRVGRWDPDFEKLLEGYCKVQL
jgi:hypothetical protein